MIFRREIERVARPHRQRHDVVEHAVDPEPDAELLLVRLDVDVGGARLQRLDQDQVGDLDDRRGLRRLGEVREVDLLAFVLLQDVDVRAGVDPGDLVHVELAETDARHVVDRQRGGGHDVFEVFVRGRTRRRGFDFSFRTTERGVP